MEVYVLRTLLLIAVYSGAQAQTIGSLYIPTSARHHKQFSIEDLQTERMQYNPDNTEIRLKNISNNTLSRFKVE